MSFLERLRYENQVLVNSGLAQFQIHRYKEVDAYYLWGEQVSNSGARYSIYSPIPNGFPDARPPVYIYKPNPLPAFLPGTTINSYGRSHSMHTLEKGSNGEVQICHWRDDRWHSGITFNKVMIKVLIWLEAYEQHRSSGEPIDNFVRTMAAP
jgi:hypothetical protein